MSSLAWLDALRTNDHRRWLVTAVAGAVGLAIVWLHWLGLIVGGALVAVPQISFRRGLLAGFGFGVLSLLAFVAWLAVAGVHETYVAMGQVRTVSTVIPLVTAPFGSLIRGVR